MIPNRNLWLALLVSLLPIACGGGFDNAEAVEQCDDLSLRLDCIDEAAYNKCVACFEDCGSDCRMADSGCPPTFACQD